MADPAGASGRTRILLADEHPLIIAGIRRTVEHLDDLEVVGEARTGEELLRMVARRRPDVVVMDERGPLPALCSRWPRVATVILSAVDDRAVIEAALASGAAAYVLKTEHPAELVSVLRRVAAGAGVHAVKGITAADDFTVAAGADDRDDPAAGSLTPRERSILCAVATGKPTSAISRELWISEHTIKFHLTNIYRKLGVPNRAAAVRYALEHGLA